MGAKMFVKVGSFVRLRNVRRNSDTIPTGNQEVVVENLSNNMTVKIWNQSS